MYIQLTTRCNMACAHCCFAATTRGPVMSLDVYLAALNLAIDTGDHVTLGGGEPTVHPHFFDFLDRAIDAYDARKLDFEPYVITNGKRKRHALRLIDYVDEGRSVGIALSQDEFHDPISPEVVRAFERRARSTSSYPRNVNVEILTLNAIVPAGRAAKNNLGRPFVFGRVPECCCATPLVDPEGNVWSCGCKLHWLGKVWDSTVLDGYDHEYAHEGGQAPPESDDLHEAFRNPVTQEEAHL